LTSNASAVKSLRKLKALIKVLPIDEKVIEQALNSNFNYFEDAIQYFSAVHCCPKQNRILVKYYKLDRF